MPLLTSEHIDLSQDWSPDGKTIAFQRDETGSGLDIWMLPLDGKQEPQPFLVTSFNERQPRFSPDGQWLAYVSDESGRPEVYVQPFPGPGAKWQVSAQGGEAPVWARDGKELFYLNSAEMMAVTILTEPSFSVGKPRLLFEEEHYLAYDVSPDGRFATIEMSHESSVQLRIVLNWFEELERLVPVN